MIDECVIEIIFIFYRDQGCHFSDEVWLPAPGAGWRFLYSFNFGIGITLSESRNLRCLSPILPIGNPEH